MNKIFSQRLKRLREEKQLTMQKLGEIVGVSGVSIGYYERDERVPDIDTLSKMCKCFGVTADYLIGLSDARTHETEDISARTGLSERAVLLLEAKHRMQGGLFLPLPDAAILSGIIETTAQPLTLEEYIESIGLFHLTDDSGKEEYTLYITSPGKEYESEGYVFQKGIEGAKEAFYLSDFAETEALPLGFRRTVLENYRAYSVLSEKSGKCPDIINILRKYYESGSIGSARLLYNRTIGIGRVTGDYTDSLYESFDGESGEIADLFKHLSQVCDESDHEVTALPIATLLDESTFTDLKNALKVLRAEYIKSQEATDAQEE